MRAGIARHHAQRINNILRAIVDRAWPGSADDRLDDGLGVASIRRSHDSRAIWQRWFEAESYRVRGEILSGAIRQIRRRPRKRSSLPSPSRNSREPRASSCAPRCRWRSFINRPIAPPTPTPYLHPRSKVFRRRRSCQRSRKHNSSLALWACKGRRSVDVG